MRGRRGQGAVEYVMLLCCCLCLVLIMGALLQRHGPELAERVMEQAVEAVIVLAMP